jgi:CRP-like cAMP-binding protein
LDFLLNPIPSVETATFLADTFIFLVDMVIPLADFRLLQKIPVLAAVGRIDDAILSNIADASCTIPFRSGQVIVSEGQLVSAMYVLLDGQVAVSVSRNTSDTKNSRGETSIVRVLRPAPRDAKYESVMCVWSMLSGQKSRVSITAMEGGATVLCISKEAIRPATENVEVLRAMAAEIASKMPNIRQSKRQEEAHSVSLTAGNRLSQLHDHFI